MDGTHMPTFPGLSTIAAIGSSEVAPLLRERL